LDYGHVKRWLFTHLHSVDM